MKSLTASIRFSFAHAHIAKKWPTYQPRPALSLSVLAVSCFKEVNFKLWIDDIEYACVGVRSLAEALYLTLSTHAREGYSSHFVCHSVSQSVCLFSILEKAPFLGLKLTSVYILGDDLSPLNVALFLKIEAILEKKRVELRPLLQ